jgi:hypothetical protein
LNKLQELNLRSKIHSLRAKSNRLYRLAELFGKNGKIVKHDICLVQKREIDKQIQILWNELTDLTPEKVQFD